MTGEETRAWEEAPGDPAPGPEKAPGDPAPEPGEIPGGEEQEKSPRRLRPSAPPPSWLMGALALCLLLCAVSALSEEDGGRGRAAGLRPGPAVTLRPLPRPSLDKALPQHPSKEAPEPSPEPAEPPGDTLEALAVPEGTAFDQSWFDDAVLIGDSRMNGFQLYSGVSGARYITSVGLSIYRVAGEEKLIRWGEDKLSVYEALEKETCAKVYLSMGVNELGYYDPEGFAETFGTVVDRVRELQKGAAVYVMTIIPVNSEKCREHKQKDYVNNDLVVRYNEALVKMAREKDVYLIDMAEALADETGEVPAELSADGVHLSKEGYVRWRDYLLCHTGT